MNKTCSVDGCGKTAKAIGMCNAHYKRYKLYGDPKKQMRYRVASAKQRLLARISKNDSTGCWEFTGCLDSKGYGLLTINNISHKAHRISYQEFVGEIPNCLFVLHKCDNRKCVNPEHLFVGTHIENMQDMVNKGRSQRRSGSKHHNAKLTESDIPEIRKRLANGDVPAKIAEKYSVHSTVITKINRKELWGHVKENCHGI